MEKSTHLGATQNKPCKSVPLLIKPATYKSEEAGLLLSLLSPCPLHKERSLFHFTPDNFLRSYTSKGKSENTYRQKKKEIQMCASDFFKPV